MSGLDGIKRKLAEAAARANKAGRAGLYESAEEIMTDAKGRAPVDLGNLKGSGTVTLPTDTPEGVVVRIGFGGPAAPYALIQHENLSFRHEVGEAKYLENAVDSLGHLVQQRVADKVRLALA